MKINRNDIEQAILEEVKKIDEGVFDALKGGAR